MKRFVYYRPVGLGIVLLTSLFVFSCSKSDRSLGEDFGIAYLPLRDGSKYVYQRECDGKPEQFTWQFRFVEGDYETPEFRIIEQNGKSVDKFLRRQGNAVVFLTEKPIARLLYLGENELYLSTWLLEGITAHDFWEDEETGMRTAVSGFESVTTPAGKFKDCIKVVIEATEMLWDVTEERLRRYGHSPEEADATREALSDYYIRWFARGVGLVKEKHGDCVMELISYNRK